MKKSVAELSDDELKAELAQLGFNPPPVTGTTRNVLQKKLETLRAGSETISKPKAAAPAKTKAPAAAPPPTPPAAAPQVAMNTSGGTFDLNGSSSTKPSFSQQNTSSLSSSFASSSPMRQPQHLPSPRSPLRVFGDGTGGGGTSAASTYFSSMFSSAAKPTPSAAVAKTKSGGIGGVIGAGTSMRASFQNTFERPTLGRDLGEDDDDDHMESSRIVSPRSRFRPSLPAGGGGAPKNFSPVEKFKNIGRTAWGFFSRPLGTSTPCSDSGYKYTGYASSPSNKYRRYGADRNSVGFYAGVGGVDDQQRGVASYLLPTDIPRWIGHGIVLFIGFLISCYIYQAHTETVHNALGTGKDLAHKFFNFVYNYALLPIGGLVIAGVILYALYWAFDYTRRQKADQKRRLIELVERITDIIFESGPAGVAEPHVRDMLMPPTKRTIVEYKRWQEAACFINNEDSRIRTEIRLIDGTECNVWIWTGAGKQRWQGSAVAEGSPMAKIPEQALTRCLKLRGVEFSDNVVERESLRKELMAKMKPIAPKHIGFMSNNAESVVYMMLRDLNDARRAFLAFHSHWFNGSMITVKYVRDERYVERFPDIA